MTVVKRDIYRRMLNPAQELAIDLLIDMEQKHGEGITLSDCDVYKCIRHATSSALGDHNPDGHSHAVATLTRSYKMVLAEIWQGRDK